MDYAPRLSFRGGTDPYNLANSPISNSPTSITKLFPISSFLPIHSTVPYPPKCTS